MGKPFKMLSMRRAVCTLSQTNSRWNWGTFIFPSSMAANKAA